ncbi:RHS repeat domain-containing protein [Polaromonas sp. YR568]|uniref:RHS repeat domain-containing protein n=1 Tax=Polaromonas sp. YR568 TaxID=1855301 RepID=UPI00398BE1D1
MKLIALVLLAAARVAVLFGSMLGTNAFASFPATYDPSVCSVAPCYHYDLNGFNGSQPILNISGSSYENTCFNWLQVAMAKSNEKSYTGAYHVEGAVCHVIGKWNYEPSYYDIAPGTITRTPIDPKPQYSCPDTIYTELSGSTCTCKAGNLENTDHNRCIPGGVGATVVDIFNSTKPPPRCDWQDGNPILPLLGGKVEPVATGMSVGGQPLVFTYSSAKQAAAVAAGKTARTFGNRPALGGLWESSLHRNLIMGTGGYGATLHRGNGRTVSFRYSGGVFIADADVTGTFTAITGGYRYFDAKSRTIETYNTVGQLTSWADTAGSTLTFSYSTAASATAPAAGYLQNITDHNGRSLSFVYSLPAGGVAVTDGLISSVTDPMGRTMNISFDANGNLARLTWPDTKFRQFVYENTSLPWALTGVIDERGIRYSTFTYDTAGRALSTEHSGGVNKYSVSYGAPPQIIVTQTYDPATLLTTRTHDWQAPSGVQLTRPNGETANASTTTVLGYPLATGLSQPAGSGCAAANNASTFDAIGNLTSTDDFSGQRSCYAYDSSNRETVRVEGLATTAACASVLPGGSALPAGSRKIETTWHTDWRLPVKVSEPLLITSTVYHGQPDPFNGNAIANCTAAAALPNGQAMPLVCKQVVQGTTDADGALGLAATVDSAVAPRSSSFTYDSQGRMLTSADPLNRVTTYAYYSTSGNFSGTEAGADPSYGSVSVLLRGGGASNSTVMTDSASSPKAVTAFGNARISTAQSKFGGSSIAFDGDGDYLSVPAGPGNNFSFGTGDFTIEGWFFLSSAGSGYRNLFVIPWGATYMMIRFGDGGFGGRLQFASEASGFPTVYSSEHTQASLAGAWHHVAFTRSGGLSRAFLDGNLLTLRNNIFSGSPVTSWADTSNIASVAQAYVSHMGGAAWLGYMDDVRITKGVARYTASFIPAAGPVLDPDGAGHTAGDLQSITNAAGHITQFTLYDRVGRLRQMIDPKGVVTDTAYTPRGWTSSVTVTPPGGAARTMTYTYDNAGQLTGANLPDGTTLGYSYDAAHRLTGVTDAKGNSITYTLDNAGNKTGEQIKDPSGNLQRNITRVYDALNRVQQVTGASN